MLKTTYHCRSKCAHLFPVETRRYSRQYRPPLYPGSMQSVLCSLVAPRCINRYSIHAASKTHRAPSSPQIGCHAQQVQTLQLAGTVAWRGRTLRAQGAEENFNAQVLARTAWPDPREVNRCHISGVLRVRSILGTENRIRPKAPTGDSRSLPPRYCFAKT
jgi:hypothetical protein